MLYRVQAQMQAQLALGGVWQSAVQVPLQSRVLCSLPPRTQQTSKGGKQTCPFLGDWEIRKRTGASGDQQVNHAGASGSSY